MRLRSLLWLPVAGVATAVALRVAVPAEAVARASTWAGFAGDLATLGACLLAARCFTASDHLWRAWSLQAVSVAALAINGLVVDGAATSAPMTWWDAATLVVSNATAIASLGFFAATLWKADLGFTASPLQRAVVTAVAALVAVGFGGVVLVSDLAAAVTQRTLRDVVYVLADATDLATFLLAAPILLVALGVRGGALAWTWGFITAANLSWILVDAASGPLRDALGDPALTKLLVDAGHATASWCWTAAALAQWLVARRQAA